MDSLYYPLAAVTDSTHGFTRPGMGKVELTDSVDAYDRHMFVCYKNREVWPPRVDASEMDPLPMLLATTVKSRNNDITIEVCDYNYNMRVTRGRWLLGWRPEMIKYRGLTESNIDSFVEDVMVNGKPWSAGVQDEIAGSYVFVCAHASRDTRCGFCGPILIDKFNEEIVLRGLKDQVFVWACSHVGGHGYAGNAIIFSPGSDGKITDHWGKMGTSVEEVNWIDDQEVTDNENVGGCCKGVDGVSRCISPSSEKTKGLSWMWPLFEEHIAVGVLGMVVAATVAYKIYRPLNHTC